MPKIPIMQKLKSELQGNKGLVQRVRQESLPSGEKLAREAWKHVSFFKRRLDAADVQENFNRYLCELIDTEYERYLNYEEKVLSGGIVELALDPRIQKTYPSISKLMKSTLAVITSKKLADVRKLVEVSKRLRPFYKLVEQSLGQGRMSRAGSSSQYHLETLLRIAGYGSEFEKQQVLNGTVDFLFPSKKVWERDRRKCVIVSMKRTLRERYKQVFEELDTTGGMTIYLLVTETFDESLRDISEPKVDKLNEQNIYLVVRDEIKQRRFLEKVNVIGFSEFIKNELPTKRMSWKGLKSKEV